MNDYVGHLRTLIGHETLLTVGCGAIIEDDEGRILLQRRKDLDIWGIPGGLMELGERFEEAARREVFEETSLTLFDIELFGLYSGPEGFSRYTNGDRVFSVQIIFRSNRYEGELRQAGEESQEHRFFHRTELPINLNLHQSRFILDWKNGARTPVID